jgi:dienelactone hydrolase
MKRRDLLLAGAGVSAATMIPSIAPWRSLYLLALSQAKKRYAINVFSGAGHGFMSDRRDSYNPAAAKEAWEIIMAFFDRHLGRKS